MWDWNLCMTNRAWKEVVVAKWNEFDTPAIKIKMTLK